MDRLPGRRWSVLADERERLLQSSVADDLVVINPGGERRSRAGLIEHIKDFQQRMPGKYFQTEKVTSLTMTSCDLDAQRAERRLRMATIVRPDDKDLSIWPACSDDWLSRGYRTLLGWMNVCRTA